MRIAFFGGSFDPPHLGHIAIARAAQQALALDRVLFAPVGRQPLKPAGSSAAFEDRVAMTRLAIAAEPAFELSLADAPQPAPNYTVETLLALRSADPPRAQWFLLLGADAFRTLRHWHRAAELPFLAQLIVASRPGEILGDLRALLPPSIALTPQPGQPNQFSLADSQGNPSQLTLLPNLHCDISATELRQQLQAPHATHPSVLAPAVLDYIRAHRLYESSSAPAQPAPDH